MVNPKLSREQKELRGTYRPSRDKPSITAKQALQEPVEPPDTMSTGGRQEWVALMPLLIEMQTCTSADLRAFEQLCETLAGQSELDSLVKAEGHLIAAANGGMKANPVVKSLETARNQSLRLLEQFGLTPRSRAHVQKAEQPPDDDDFETL